MRSRCMASWASPRRGKSQNNDSVITPAARPPPPPPLTEPQILARETACLDCLDFLGGFKREQYRCRAKKGCTRLRIASSHERCTLHKWGP